jgi:hypothetical protein
MSLAYQLGTIVKSRTTGKLYSVEQQGLWEGKIIDGFFIATTKTFVVPNDEIVEDLEVYS